MIDWIIMALDLDIHVIDTRGPSNKMRRQFQPKKTKVWLLSIYITVNSLLYITNKMGCFSFKSGCVVRMANGQLQPKNLAFYQPFITKKIAQ